MVIISESEPK